jgi:hypothetical protein
MSVPATATLLPIADAGQEPASRTPNVSRACQTQPTPGQEGRQ